MEKGEKMARLKEDLTGKQFGRLTVLKRAEDYIDSNGYHRLCWRCKCECTNGTILDVPENRLKTGNTRSCGCLQKEQLAERSKKQFKKYNDYEVQEDYVIMYTQKGEMFLVDLDEFWKVKNICWCKNNGGYLSGANTENQEKELLHRYIMNCPAELEVDHINSKAKYDNRKSNLRVATRQQNSANKGISSRNKSGVTGVSWSKSQQKWRARIHQNHKEIHLGYFENFEDAVHARKQAEEKIYGDFTYDNSQRIWREVL